MRQDYRAEMEAHPLRREIIVTQIVNSMVNFSGITFFHRLSQETSSTAEELARAHLVSREVYGADRLIERINELDNKVGADVQTEMRLWVRTLIERATRWMVNNRRSPIDSEATVEHFGSDIETLVRALPDILAGTQGDEFAARRDNLTSRGVEAQLATDIAVLPSAYTALEVVEISKHHDVGPVVAGQVHARLSERLGLSDFGAKIEALPREDRWQTMARASLRDDFYAVHAALTAQVIDGTDPEQDAEKRVAVWEAAQGEIVDRSATTLEEILGDDAVDLARLSVGLRVIRALLATH
jgi:glutamate dehydrogenase